LLGGISKYDNKGARGDYICGQCGAGDAFKLLQREHGWSFTQLPLQHLVTG
jgi:hypothetical protein